MTRLLIEHDDDSLMEVFTYAPADGSDGDWTSTSGARYSFRALLEEEIPRVVEELLGHRRPAAALVHFGDPDIVCEADSSDQRLLRSTDPADVTCPACREWYGVALCGICGEKLHRLAGAGVFVDSIGNPRSDKPAPHEHRPDFSVSAYGVPSAADPFAESSAAEEALLAEEYEADQMDRELARQGPAPEIEAGEKPALVRASLTNVTPATVNHGMAINGTASLCGRGPAVPVAPDGEGSTVPWRPTELGACRSCSANAARFGYR